MYIDTCKDNASEQQPSEAWSPELVTEKDGWKELISSALLGEGSSQLMLICSTLTWWEIKGTAFWRCLWLKCLPLYCLNLSEMNPAVHRSGQVYLANPCQHGYTIRGCFEVRFVIDAALPAKALHVRCKYTTRNTLLQEKLLYLMGSTESWSNLWWNKHRSIVGVVPSLGVAGWWNLSF